MNHAGSTATKKATATSRKLSLKPMVRAWAAIISEKNW